MPVKVEQINEYLFSDTVQSAECCRSVVESRKSEGSPLELGKRLAVTSSRELNTKPKTRKSVVKARF